MAAYALVTRLAALDWPEGVVALFSWASGALVAEFNVLKVFVRSLP